MKKILKIFIIAPVILAALIYLTITAYLFLDNIGILNGYNNYFFQKKLKHFIFLEIKEVKLKDLTNFKWDKVCSYAPYNWHSNQHAWTLVFEKNKEIILASEMKKAYLNTLWNEECANYNNATLLFFEYAQKDEPKKNYTQLLNK